MWWENARRHYLLDFHIPDERGYALENVEPKQIAAEAKRAGVEVLYIHAKDNQGRVYYNSAVGRKHAQLDNRDLFGEIVEAAHDAGLRLVAYANTTRDKLAFDSHPSWRQKWHNKRDRGAAQENPDWDNLCPHSPYRFFMEAIVEEICARYEVDGIWLDHPDFGGTGDKLSCYCSFCASLFEWEFSRELPISREDVAWPTFLAWRQREIKEYLSELAAIARRVRPPVAITFNYLGWLDAFSIWSHAQDIEDVTEVADFLAGEIHPEREGTIAPSVSTQLAQASSNGKPSAVGIFRFTGDYDFTLKEPSKFEAEVFSAMANGGGVLVADQVYPDGSIEPLSFDLTAKANQVVEGCTPWLQGAKRVPFAAVLFSKATRHGWGGDHADKYLNDFHGTVRALMASHVPFELITERALTEELLDRYSALVLPSAVDLGDAECQAIQEWTEKGGGLVATGLTSLRSGHVHGFREDFGLKTVLGVSYRGIANTPYTYLWHRDETHDLLPEENFGPMMMRGPSTRVAEQGAQVVAYATKPDWGFGTVSGKPHLHPPKRQPSIQPAVTVNNYGEGVAVYFPTAIGAAYNIWGYVALEKLLGRSVLWAAKEAPPARVSVPPDVEATVFEQTEPNRTIIHLVRIPPPSPTTSNIVRTRFFG